MERGTVPSIFPVARLRGGEPLNPETSVNTTAGAVLEQGTLILTADYFRIDVDDRMAVTQDFTLTAAEVDQLLEAGVENARGLASFRFFTNDISTTTQGVDLVFSYAPPRLKGGTVFSAVFNHTDTRVTHFNPDLLNAARRLRELQEALPRNRWNAGVSQKIGPVNVLGRLNYYGAWFDWDSAQTLFSGKPVFDLEVGVPLSEQTRLAIGGPQRLQHLSRRLSQCDQRGRAVQRIHALGIQRRLFLLPPGLLIQEAGAVVEQIHGHHPVDRSFGLETPPRLPARTCNRADAVPPGPGPVESSPRRCRPP